MLVGQIVHNIFVQSKPLTMINLQQRNLCSFGLYLSLHKGVSEIEASKKEEGAYSDGALIGLNTVV